MTDLAGTRRRTTTAPGIGLILTSLFDADLRVQLRNGRALVVSLFLPIVLMYALGAGKRGALAHACQPQTVVLPPVYVEATPSSKTPPIELTEAWAWRVACGASRWAIATLTTTGVAALSDDRSRRCG